MTKDNKNVTGSTVKAIELTAEEAKKHDKIFYHEAMLLRSRTRSWGPGQANIGRRCGSCLTGSGNTTPKLTWFYLIKKFWGLQVQDTQAAPPPLVHGDPCGLELKRSSLTGYKQSRIRFYRRNYVKKRSKKNNRRTKSKPSKMPGPAHNLPARGL